MDHITDVTKSLAGPIPVPVPVPVAPMKPFVVSPLGSSSSLGNSNSSSSLGLGSGSSSSLGLGSSSSGYGSGSSGIGYGSREFLASNSMIAKFAFLLLALFAFLVLLHLGTNALAYWLAPSSTAKLLDGMIDAKEMIVVPQDPNSAGALTLQRSVNEDQGIEFTWSVWIFVDNLTYKEGQYRCVFYKGNDFAQHDSSTLQESMGLNFPNNAPGMYLAPEKNSLVIMMNTFDVINEEIHIHDIPIHKWLNVVIRCEGNTVDVYVNGTVAKSHQLHGVVKQNFADVYISPNGGFSGYTSNLWYYNYAIGLKELTDVVAAGPNTSRKDGNNDWTSKISNYLSMRWFYPASFQPS